MLTGFLVALVELSRRWAVALSVLALAVTLALGVYVVRHFAIDTDVAKLISADLPWRQRDAEFDREFPQFTDLIAVVIDAATPDEAGEAASRLARELERRTDLFRSVRSPDGDPFFRRNGLLFLSKDEVASVIDEMMQAQPLIGTLASDPSLRGLMDALGQVLEGVARGAADLESLRPPLLAVDAAAGAALDGKPGRLSWQGLLTGRAPDKSELRRFLLVQPVLDFTELAPGGKATDGIRAAARTLGLTPENGIRVRLTGPVPLGDEEFASVAEGAALATTVSLALVCVLLFLALRSPALMGAVLATLIVGLIGTAAFGLAAIGRFNMISVAFAVLFVGLGVDFAIQFAVRYRDERYRTGDLAAALRQTAAGVGPALALAASAAALGFLSFVPTPYAGVRELGLIAGFGMVLAFFLNMTLLPALIRLIRPKGEPAPVGFAWAARVDRAFLAHRRTVIAVAILLAMGSLLVMPKLRFDFDPLNLKDPHAESVAVLRELMTDPTTTPYTLNVLVPSPKDVAQMAERLDASPEVARTVSVMSFVPDDQEAKLQTIGDAALILGPTLSGAAPATAPTPAETRQAVKETGEKLAGLAGGDAALKHVADTLARVAIADDAHLVRVEAALVGGLPFQLESLALSLQAAPITLETLPDSIKSDWVAPDGRARIEVFPKGSMSTNAGLERFVRAILPIAPEATGTPVLIQESGRTVVGAFVTAGWIAAAAITILLVLVLRRIRDVLLVLAPLALAGLLTLATGVLLGLPLNFANVITLPLLLGIGVAFDIYFVLNWRAGMEHPLASATARAVLFSAATTTVAFGGLALSHHLGTSEMGILLTMGLAYTVATIFLLLPALMGPPPKRR